MNWWKRSNFQTGKRRDCWIQRYRRFCPALHTQNPTVQPRNNPWKRTKTNLRKRSIYWSWSMKAYLSQQWTYPWIRMEAKRGNFTRKTRNYGKTRMKSRIPSMRLGNQLLVKRVVKIMEKRHKDWFCLRYRTKESTTEDDNFFGWVFSCLFFFWQILTSLSFKLRWKVMISYRIKSIF